MKSLIALIFSASLAFAAEPPPIKLDYKTGKADDYAAQIQAGFSKLLTSNSTLARQFTQFQAPPPEDERGRYSGKPIVVPILMSEEESVDFGDSGGKVEFTKGIALYYRFDEGLHRGSATVSGFFALFTVSGNLTYSGGTQDDSDLTSSSVVATFLGFSRTLTGPAPDDDSATQGTAAQPNAAGSAR